VALIPVNPDPVAVIESHELRLLGSHLPSILPPDIGSYKLYEGYWEHRQFSATPTTAGYGGLWPALSCHGPPQD